MIRRPKHKFEWPTCFPILHCSVDKLIFHPLFTVLDHFPIQPKAITDLSPPPINTAKNQETLSFILSFPHSSISLITLQSPHRKPPYHSTKICPDRFSPNLLDRFLSCSHKTHHQTPWLQEKEEERVHPGLEDPLLIMKKFHRLI